MLNRYIPRTFKKDTFKIFIIHREPKHLITSSNKYRYGKPQVETSHSINFKSVSYWEIVRENVKEFIIEQMLEEIRTFMDFDAYVYCF